MWINAPVSDSEGRILYIQIEDRREQTAIGINRIRGHSQTLLADRNLIPRLTDLTRKAFSSLGYTLSATPLPDRPRLTVQLLDLWYEVNPENFRKVETRSRLAVTAEAGGRTWSRVYNHSSNEELLLLPDLTGQQRRLALSLTSVLRDLVADPALRSFINEDDAAN